METPADDAFPARMLDLPSWLLTQTAVYAHRMVGDGLAAVDARRYHYRVLAALDQYGPASQAALGRHSGIHLSDMVATVNELAEQGYAARAPDPADRRRNIITLTPSGRRRLRQLDGVATRVQDELLEPLTPGERDELARLLRAVLAHHAGRSGRAEE